MPALCSASVGFQLHKEASRLALSHAQHLPGTPCTHERTASPASTIQAGGLVKFGLFGLHVLTGFARVNSAPTA
jgi:hypothetical protein